MLHLMKHLHYWIGLEKAIAKITKETTFSKKPLDNILFKGCAHYIFASLFFKSKPEHFSN